MKLIPLTLCLLLPAAPQTMRVDYDHTGNATGERFSLDRAVLEPLPWPGNPSRPIDDTGRGKYRPQADCIMFTRDAVPFCAVCRRAIDAILDLYSRLQ